MKRIALLISFFAVCAGLCFSQQSIFVSAAGDDNNNGRSEDSPYKTVKKALAEVQSSGIGRITVIGVLDAKSENEKGETVFMLFLPDGENELLVSGMRGASGEDQAVLSGEGSGLSVLRANGEKARIRLENIEIIDAEGGEGAGLLINGATVTLGPGAIVRNNKTGVKLTEGSCVVDGGEVKDNSHTGIVVAENCILTMRGGAISKNQAKGVVVQKGGRFSMTAGSITENHDLQEGAGVYVHSGGRFDQTAGTIDFNVSPEFPNVCRETGSFGNDLSMTTALFRPPPDSSASFMAPAKGIDYHVPLYISFYGQGWKENIVSLGLVLQLGIELGLSKSVSFAVLGEADGGLGYPYVLEGNLLGAAEFYFARKRFALSAGYGIHARSIDFEEIFFHSGEYEFGTDEIFQSAFYRFAAIYRGNSKITLFVTHYDKREWLDIENWSFGIQFGKDFFSRGKR